MLRPRTIFGPYAAAAVLVLGIALARFERPLERASAERVELTEGSMHRLVQEPQRPRVSAAQLRLPVDGVRRSDLADTWGQARSEGRTHEGIDIMAPAGTRVRAAVDGRIVKFFDSVRGGITISQFDAREQYVYYYAHLQARAADLAEGDVVRLGDLLGYVGQTGNATTPHLHFEIQRLGPERQWWIAEALNPYPYLISGRAPVAAQ